MNMDDENVKFFAERMRDMVDEWENHVLSFPLEFRKLGLVTVVRIFENPNDFTDRIKLSVGMVDPDESEIEDEKWDDE